MSTWLSGPANLQQVPDLIEKARAGDQNSRWPSALVARTDPPPTFSRSHETFDPLRDPTMRPTPFQAYLRIQIGCDKFCTYCIVPMTRGPEQGRSPQVRSSTKPAFWPTKAAKEITLLGQTVNSYKFTDASGGNDRLWPTCLYSLHDIEGIERHQVRHELSEGHDFRRLLETIRDLPKCLARICMCRRKAVRTTC